jgi:hypothetical protein
MPLESNSEGGREVFMVGQGEKLPEKTAEEIQQEAEEEIAQAARDTTQSSTHDVLLVETDSETSHGPSKRRSVGSSTKESMSTVRRPTTPWPRGCL